MLERTRWASWNSEPARSALPSVRASAFFDPFGDFSIDLDERRRRIATFASLVILAVGALAFITFGANRFGVASTERHLRNDVERSVLVDYPSVSVAVDHRIVRLRGSVRNLSDRTKVIRRVAARWGVESVDVSGLRTSRSGAGPSRPT